MIEYYLNELLSEGIYHVPMWSDSPECGASASATVAMASASDAVAMATSPSSSSATASSSGPALLRAPSSASTMQLGASARNIAIDSEGNQSVSLSVDADFYC